LTTQGIEAILADFRSWLQQPRPALDASLDGRATSESGAQPIDLHTLLGQFIALRHEINLQTKAVRGQQEQNSETLRQLTQALQALRQAQDRALSVGQKPADDDDLRSVLKALVDLYDALAPAEREVQRVAQAVLPDLDQLNAAPETAPASPRRRGFWARLFGGAEKPPAAPPGAGRREQVGQAVERIRLLLGSLLTGYTMSLRRLERALQQQGLEPIPCAGEPFDPEQMEVVEVVADSGRPGGEVLEEVRRGYLWRGRVFRYAQVKVAKP
jgi:molecular chaperone GrpE